MMCCDLQILPVSKSVASTGETIPSVSVVALQSQLGLTKSQSLIPSSNTSVEPSGGTPQPKLVPVPVPMSATPPSTCIRPKVLASTPQTSDATSPSLTAGIRPPRPSQPLPPVRTSSCPTKVIPKHQEEVYEEVRMHEPDLNRRPARSALKGSKSTGAQSFQQQLEKVLSLSHKFAGCHPFPAAIASSADTINSTGLSRSKSGDCGKLATKSLPAVAPKPRIR